MREKYCLPIIKHYKKAVFDEIEHNLPHYGFFEVWLDYIENVDETFVSQLVERYPRRIILLFRRERLEPTEMPFDSRYQLLQLLDRSSVLIDFDIKSQLAEFEYVAVNNLKLQIIGSYHNYKGTPDLQELELIVAELKTHHPEILKIATFCHDELDALRLLQLQQQLKKQHHKHIVLGMGTHGVVTRIFGSLWGNELIFAPISADGHSATGQLTRKQLDAIFQDLDTKNV